VQHSCSARAKGTLFWQKVRARRTLAHFIIVNALYVFLGSNLSFNW